MSGPASDELLKIEQEMRSSFSGHDEITYRIIQAWADRLAALRSIGVAASAARVETRITVPELEMARECAQCGDSLVGRPYSCICENCLTAPPSPGQVDTAGELRSWETPDGFRLVPEEATPEMIDQGAQGMASFQDGSVWPDSWEPLQVRQMRRDAEKAYRYMIYSAPPPDARASLPSAATKKRDALPSDLRERISNALQYSQPGLAATIDAIESLINSLGVQASPQPGHKLVAREPTPEQIEAAAYRETVGEDNGVYVEIFRAMWDAAPCGGGQ